jgi:mono/diheme cytochrome c family protein
VAIHGSWNRAPKPQAGYCVAFVPFDASGMPSGGYEVFANGFAGPGPVQSPSDAHFRPGGLAVGPDGSLYVNDTDKGRVWRIFYTGEEVHKTGAAPTARPQPRPSVRPRPSSAAKAAGAALYAANCAVCHMADGGGAPGMQPAIKGSRVVAGEPRTLVQLLIQGPDKVLPANRTPYENQMPTFEALTDDEVAALTNYVRKQFGGVGGGVTAVQVKGWR